MWVGSPEFWSCDSAVTSSLVFDFLPLGLAENSAFYDAMCGYEPCIGSMMLCCDELVNSDPSKMKKIFHVASEACTMYSSFHYKWTYYRDQYENATKNVINPSDITNYSLPVYGPTYPNMTDAILINKGYQYFYKNLDDATFYSIGIWVYFGLVILIAAFFKFLKRTGASQMLCNPLINIIRSYITLPAMIPDGHCSEQFGWKYFSFLLPNRIESLVGFGLTIVEIVFYCIPYHQKESAYLFTTSDQAWKRYVADRAGILSFGKVPLLILFAGRNNMLCFLTGIKYSSFIQYHKMVSRWMLIDALIHAVSYTIIEKGAYVAALKESYFACGVAASVIGGCMWLFSFHVFREYSYEIFLYFHIIMAIAFIIMCWYHCNTLGWGEWLITACCLWGVDRLIRVLRMTRFGYQTARFEIINETSYRVTVPRPKSFNSAPGQYGFVYFSDPFLFFQNHPFTLINNGDSITFYIKAKKGVTARIMKQLSKTREGTMLKKICIEGPYGDSSPVGRFDNTLLIAGGAGIPGVADYAMKLGAREELKMRIKFVWILQTLKGTETYIRDLVSKLRNTKVEVDLYLTQETSQSSNDVQRLLSQCVYCVSCDEELTSSSSENNKKRETSNIDFISINYGRPEMKDLLKEELESFGAGSLAIVSCGPGKMGDALRSAVSKEVLKSKSRIDFFDELQVW
ncbi:hypothetical protein FOA43_001647 [Brettanomyces nanus]|uniref:ferric-chelate reductase (NADPH) n=1 Tax=Eeniella nana TaxID=13502 RepID=A0A875RNZ0_EENNA|nr:uncharacterized protein FOA43_001647 [Brettanomyces nanus]QPG74320.1 hypothetical protein FOA43_001647 [Brettanomyces nanus]